MQKEPIFIFNTKLHPVEITGSYYTTKIDGIRRIIKNLEPIGNPFSIIVKSDVNTMNPFTSTPEFKELADPLPIASTLEHYLRKASIETVLGKREDNLPQYLGIIYGKPSTIKFITGMEESSKGFKRNIIPCQFYLINDDLSLH